VLPQYFSNFKVRKTEKAGDAKAWAAGLEKEGIRRIVSVGGDGTLHEIINGVMQLKKSNEIKIGVLPLGSGNDFGRTLKLPKDFHALLEIINCGRTQKVDVTQIQYTTLKNTTAKQWMINIADFGFGGQVMQKVNSSKKSFGGKLTYLGSILSSIWPLKTFSGVLHTREQNYHFHEVLMVVVANGKFFGSGLCVAPDADIQDGMLNVIVVEKMPLIEFLKILPRLYQKETIDHPSVFRLKTNYLSWENTSVDPVYLETDGEQPGIAPLECKVYPSHLSFFVV